MLGASIKEKARILLKAINTIKNWHAFVGVYLNVVKSDHVILQLRNGIKIRLRVNSTDLMAFTHVWLLKEYEKPGFDIQNNDIVIDIGGHIGLFVLFSSQYCKEGKIYCFEPVKENFDMLKSNVELNNIDNVIAVNAAVSATNGTVTIYLNDDESGHSMYVHGGKSIQVKSISLAEIFDSYGISRCNYLKVDCEGEEYQIMGSLPAKYFDNIDKMCIEYHFVDVKPHLLEELVKRLKSLSYAVDARNILPNIGFLYASK